MIIMKKWMKQWSLALTLLLGACSSSPQKVYYQLPLETESATASVAPAAGRHLWVDSVALADYLSNSGIVFQTSEVRYTIANNNQWASPLDQQLQQALVASLRGGLPGWSIGTQQTGSEQASLQVRVSAFQGRYDGKAVIRGEWTLRNQERIVTRPFQVEVAQTDDGYDALVQALSQGWRQVSHDIARQAASQS